MSKFIDAVLPGKLAQLCKTENGSLLRGLALLALGAVLANLVFIIHEIQHLLFLNDIAQTELPYFIKMTVVRILTGVLTNFLVALIVLLLFHVILKLLGGTGSFSRLLYLSSIPYVLLSLAKAVLEDLGIEVGLYLNLPLIDTLAALIVYLYGFYLLYIVGKTVHGMKGIRPIIGIVLTAGIVLGTLLIIVLMLLLQLGLAAAASQGRFGQ